jgi:hypothetical protein
MGKRRWRTQKLIDKKQQLRFAFELVVYAMLFPMYFLILALASAIVNSFLGSHTERMQPLYELLLFCTGHWWEFLVALAMVSGISILFSHKIVGPIHRFEKALIQKTENPTEPVNCTLRSRDYFHDFSQRLQEFLNAPQASAGSGDPEGSTQSRDPKIYDEDPELSTSLH